MSRKSHSPDLWDSIAAQYDAMRPDQSLADPHIRQHWQELYAELLPGSTCTILDAGCGTGSLALALAETGHRLIGIDFSPKMVEQAQAKAKQFGSEATFFVQDAVRPDFPARNFDAVVCRQVLWALPDQKAALANWADLLKPQSLLILIEGLFASGNGMSEAEILACLPDKLEHVETRDLGADPLLWGKPLDDQRYLFVARRKG